MMDTIYAAATPLTTAGLCVLRLSGPQAGQCLEWLTGKPLPAARMATLCWLYRCHQGITDKDAPIDEALVLYFPAPHSFTGEEVVELHVHGSRAVTHLLLTQLAAFPGCRLAEPGEFAKRAFTHGKMDLTQAEGLSDLIAAETELQHRHALRQTSGELASLYEGWRQELLELMAYVEAYIDFPEDDIPEALITEAESGISTIHDAISRYLEENIHSERLRDGLTVVVIGAPNAGKSTLLNRLASRDVAITSEEAGTTRDTLEVHLSIHSYPMTLIDTAGLREAESKIEQEGIRRAREKASHADIVLALFDATDMAVLDAPTLEWVTDGSLVVVNKCDAVSEKGGGLLPDDRLYISAKTGEGMDLLCERLAERARAFFSFSEMPIITRARYREHLTHARDALRAINMQDDPVMTAEHLRHAARSIEKITGKIDVDDVLDLIFSRFCIGK